MATLPIHQIPVQPSVETLEQGFRRLAAKWLTETSHLSSTSDQIAHAAFQEIVDMGEPVVPLILRELEKQSGHWHRALKKITHADPVTPSNRGDIEKITKAWLCWGKKQEYEAWLYENKVANNLVQTGLAQAKAGEFSKNPPDL